MPILRRLAAIIAAPALLALSAQAAPPEPGFYLPGLAPGAKTGWVTALSSDGNTAAGFTADSGSYVAGYTWNFTTGRSDFGLLPGMPPYTPAYGLSDNGVVVGVMQSGLDPSRAYRWTGSGPLQDLGVLPGEERMFANGVSGDGTVVVGYGEHGKYTALDGQAFRWTPTKGMQGLGYLHPFSINSHANAISRDGNTIVGTELDWTLTQRAFVWREASGMTALPWLPNPFSADTDAEAVSADGSVVVGSAFHSSGNTHAVRWVNGEIEDLTIGSSFGGSKAYAVSGDGKVVGGIAGPAIIWTSATGMMDAEDYLALFGVVVPAEYRIERIHAISGDGLTFAGEARNLTTWFREGFVATVPATGGPCKPDCDASGTLNIDDFICFQTYFALGDGLADCDNSQSLDINDFICFQTAFVLGC